MDSSAGHLMRTRNKGKAPYGSGQALESTYRPVCKNKSCTAALRRDSVFCKVCSCHLCGLYDDKRDPSLWISCELDSPQDDCCEMSCHIECAIKAGHLGVSCSGPFMPFDVSYWCTSCGKISDIIGLWKQQLALARDAENLGDLCHRFSLGYKLMENTVRYATLHTILKDTKSHLELEVSCQKTQNQVTKRSKGKQSSVSNLPVAPYLRTLCTAAITMADMPHWEPDTRGRVGGVPPACRILVEDVYKSSIVIILNDCPTALMDGITRFDLWCWQYQQEDFPEAPIASFEASYPKVTIKGLQASAEYAIRIVSSKTTGTFSVTEAKFFTQDASIIHKSPDPPVILGSGNETPHPQCNSLVIRPTSKRKRAGNGPSSSRRAVPTISVQVSSMSGRTEGFLSGAAGGGGSMEQDCGPSENEAPRPQSNSLVIRPTSEGTREGNGPSSCRREVPNISVQVSGLSGRTEGLLSAAAGVGSMEQDCGTSERSAEIQALCAPHSSSITHLMDLNAPPLPDLDADLAPPSETSQAEAGVGHQVNAAEIIPPVQAPDPTQQVENVTYRYCVSAIRRLERENHVTQVFRQKFVTWFTFKATELEKDVCLSYFGSLADTPAHLAGQLMDTFSSSIFKE